MNCLIAVLAIVGLTLCASRVAESGEHSPSIDADTALVVAVDVSNSVDRDRYRIQMDGIAAALEDESVIQAITSGDKGAIFLSVVMWADSAEVTLPWRRISSHDEAIAVAQEIRKLPQKGGEYTCLSRMLGFLNERVVPGISGLAEHVVVDVSGDGIDNCVEKEATDFQRDQLTALGVTINGLPIMVPGENDVVGAGAYRAPGFGLKELPRGPDSETTTLDAWYRAHVIGGTAAFLLPANGYQDFPRAFRQKFVSEISSALFDQRFRELPSSMGFVVRQIPDLSLTSTAKAR